jgi:hypothetical protein
MQLLCRIPCQSVDRLVLRRLCGDMAQSYEIVARYCLVAELFRVFHEAVDLDSSITKSKRQNCTVMAP